MYNGGVSLSGDDELAKKLLPEALRLADLVATLRTQGGLDSLEKVYDVKGGTVRVVSSEYINHVYVHASPSPEDEEVEEEVLVSTPEYLLMTQWEPEGLLLTPTTAEQPKGWGLPRRVVSDTGERVADPLGTAAGALPQVLLNRFEGNKYLDDGAYISSEEDVVTDILGAFKDGGTRDSYETAFDASVLYRRAVRTGENVAGYSTPDDEILDTYRLGENAPVPGLYSLSEDDGELVAGLIAAQADIQENEGEGWVCHRPEERLYASVTDETIFQTCNNYRTAVGEAAVYRALRGDADAGGLAAYSMSGSGVAAHSAVAFKPGYRTTAGRMRACTGVDVDSAKSDNSTENLFFVTPEYVAARSSVELGEDISQGWFESAYHYTNIVNAKWTKRDFVPANPWTQQGSLGAAMMLGGGGVGEVTRLWDKDAPTYVLHEVEFGAATVKVQTFSAKPTWLPVYGAGQDFALGRAGIQSNGGNEYFYKDRSVLHKTTRFEIKADDIGTSPASLEASDEFISIAGVAPYTKITLVDGEDPLEEPWVRVLYWAGPINKATDLTPEATITLRSIIFPAGMTDASFYPWEDPPEKAMQREFDIPFRAAEGWSQFPGMYVSFKSDGTEFVFEHEKVVGPISPVFMRLGFSANGQSYSPTDSLLSENAYTPPYNIGSLKRVSMKVVPDGTVDGYTLTTLYDADPPVASVSYGSQAPTNNTYTMSVQGEINVFPHYDSADNVQFCQLLINEYAGQGYFSPLHGVSAPDVVPADVFTVYPGGDRDYAWRYRALRFPSGKEIVYMQQYCVGMFSYTLPGGGVVIGAPGDGENFMGVVHYLDLPTETVIYSKHSTQTRRLDYANTLTTQQSGRERYVELTSGGASTYYLDAFPLTERVTETLADYPMPETDSRMWVGHTPQRRSHYRLDEGAYTPAGENSWVSGITAQYGWVGPRESRFVYCMTNTPVCLPRWSYAAISFGIFYGYPTPSEDGVTVSLTDVSIESAPDYVVNNFYNGGGFANPMAAKWVYSGLDTGIATNGAIATAGLLQLAIPAVPYPVTVSTAPSGWGNSSLGPWAGGLYTRNYGTFPEAPPTYYYGQQYAGFIHNVAPMFSRDHEVRAKFVTYKDRWVARIGIRHINSGACIWPEPPQNGKLFRAADLSGESGNYNSFRYNLPESVDTQTIDATSYFTGGPRQPNRIRQIRGNKMDVHIASNFDLDVAVDISDVTDIEPFGRL